MLTNYFRLALRNLAKNRLYVAINVFGLSIGLSVFLLSDLLVSYERNHDHMFAERERIYIAGSVFAPEAQESISEYPTVRLAFAPLLEAELPEAEVIARAIVRNRIVTVDGQPRYETLRFVDPGFTQIFDFQYLHGNGEVTSDPSALVVTRSTAIRLFGSSDVIGRTVTLENTYSMRVAAVIEDVPLDSHFNSSLIPDSSLAAFASIESLRAVGGLTEQDLWNSFNPADMTYLLMPSGYQKTKLQQQINAVYSRHVTEREQLYVKSLYTRTLTQVHTQAWRSLGFPVFETIRLLGLLVLLTSCLNYANLTTAQNFGRTREVGLRKAFGASRSQLIVQFLTESLLLTALTTLVALAGVELILPLFNQAAAKSVELNYWQLIPALVLITIVVGLVSGAYPAWLIARGLPADDLANRKLTSGHGVILRHLMVGVQFAIAMFIVAMVFVIFAQNKNVYQLSRELLQSNTLVLERMNIAGISERQVEAKQQLGKIPSVEQTSLSSGIPFLQTGRWRAIELPTGSADSKHELGIVFADQDFLSTYNIELTAGRTPSQKQPNSPYEVIINEATSRLLGYSNPVDALGATFSEIEQFNYPDARRYQVVGLTSDSYFLGVHMRMRPLAFAKQSADHQFLSLRIADNADPEQVEQDIASVWQRIYPEYPLWQRPLQHYFERFYRIPVGLHRLMGVFAGIALSLALIGLLGLTAFMARMRTKEIGVRKVMGAGTWAVVRLLLRQLVWPILGALLVALPLAYFASDIYLDFFADRIGFVAPLVLLAGMMVILLATLVVVANAITIARLSPAKTLRYE